MCIKADVVEAANAEDPVGSLSTFATFHIHYFQHGLRRVTTSFDSANGAGYFPGALVIAEALP